MTVPALHYAPDVHSLRGDIPSRQEIYIPSAKIFFNNHGGYGFSDAARNLSSRTKQLLPTTPIELPRELVDRLVRIATLHKQMEALQEQIKTELEPACAQIKALWTKPVTVAYHPI